jgi:hypothetical protein
MLEFYPVVALPIVLAKHFDRVDDGIHGGYDRNGESHGKLWDDGIRKFYHSRRERVS